MSEQEMTKTTFRLPKSLLKEAKHFAIEHDKSDTEVFNEALVQYLEKNGKKK